MGGAMNTTAYTKNGQSGQYGTDTSLSGRQDRTVPYKGLSGVRQCRELGTSRRTARADSLSNPDGTASEWAIASALAPLDKVVVEAEARWGVGQLERLVSPATAARFGSARKKLDDA